jgi:hypothetical protein
MRRKRDSMTETGLFVDDSVGGTILDKQGWASNLKGLRDASVAQLAELLTLNQLVEGSSPSRGTIQNRIET